MKPLGLGLALGSLLGCVSLERETPAVRTYGLSARRERSEPGRGTLAVGRVDVSPRYAGRAFVYRQTDVLYEADPYHAFLADPEVLVREEATRWLRDAGLFAHVGPPGTADVRLELEVQALYGDYRSRAAPRAVLEIRALARGADGRPRLDRTYEAAAPLADLERATLVRGWEEGLKDILERLTADVARLDESRPPPAD